MTDLEAEATVKASYNRLRGRLAGLIESWGLDERQERAAISTMKSLTYDMESEAVGLVKRATIES